MLALTTKLVRLKYINSNRKSSNLMLFKICDLETKNFEDFVSKKVLQLNANKGLQPPGRKTNDSTFAVKK